MGKYSTFQIPSFKYRILSGTWILYSDPISAPNLISHRKPYVEYQEYWRLVSERPDGPIETYLCSYIVDWDDQTARNFRGLIAQPTQVFDEKVLLWQHSTTCKEITALLRRLLGTKTVKKVLGFGLGDFCRCAPEWLKKQHGSWCEASEVENVTASLIQHSMALTIAQLCSGNKMVPILAQDPDYTEMAETILTEKGFEIVGTHGAGGFAEIDEESIVIAPFTAGPVKQIIAEIARPVLIISDERIVFNEDEFVRLHQCSSLANQGTSRRAVRRS